MVASFSMASIVACTIAQMFAFGRSSNNISLFASEFIPHEVIKKLSWFTYLPLYLVYKAKVTDIITLHIKKIINTCCKYCNKESVKPSSSSSSPLRRSSLIIANEINKNMSFVGQDIIGRQFGEEIAMIIIFIMLIPFVQNNLFPSEAAFPSFENLSICFIAIAFTTETIGTIIFFYNLEKAGYELDHKVIKMDLRFIVMFIFAGVTFMMMLKAGIL